MFYLLPSVQTGKRKRSSEDGDQDFEADEDSGDSSARCPVKKSETRLYDLYRSKWCVQCLC